MAKILIVEDSNDIIEMLEILLETFGHKTTRAHSKEQAYAKLQSFIPDLILIDVLIGEYNGKDLCMEIRETNATVPIILMSANPALLHDYSSCKADDILEKPFDIITLKNKIDKLLNDTAFP